MKKHLRYLAGAIFLMTGSTVFGQYCTPTAGSNGCQYGDFIRGVSFGTINNQNTGCSGSNYGDFTAMSTTVDLGVTYTASVVLNDEFDQGIALFIDWNQDFDFTDAGECYTTGAISYYGTTTNLSINVPANAMPGTTRMRVMCQYNNPAGPGNSCATSGNYGEFEDYSLFVRNVLLYSASVTDNASENPSVTLNNFSTCQTSVSLAADCSVFDGSSWNPGQYVVTVNGSNIGTYNGAQTIDLTSYIPVTSVFIDPTELMDSTSVNGTVQIISNSLSTPTLPTTSNVTYCQNETSDPLEATLTGTGTVLKWFTSADGDDYSATAPTPSTVTDGTVSYWVAQAEVGGCESPRRKIDVLVNALPASPVATDQAFCDTVTVDDLDPAPSTTYQWFDSEASTTELSSGTTLNEGSYYLAQTDANGCESERTAIEVDYLATSSLTTETACESFTWDANETTYTTSGVYTTLLTNAAGCDSILTLDLTIGTLPNAVATDNGDGTITASSGSTYAWIDCDTEDPISGATGQTFAPAENGSYAVIVTNASGCAETSDCVEIDNLSVKEAVQLNAEVYPNPTNGQITVVSPAGELSFELTDAKGALLQRGTITSGNTLHLNAYQSGVYFLKLNANTVNITQRIVKQ